MKLSIKERASKAGKASWAKLNKKQRAEKARKGGVALWNKIRAGTLTKT